ncbi:MAG: T9SS type B sorting domain-containing protein, partial [Chitinophagaceae bacterium]
NNTVLDKPVIQLPFKDTLICSIDALQLNVVGEGTVQWSPNIQISNINIRNPIVTPKDTITYKVRLENNGCINEDSIKVNVLDFISVFAGLDTAICKTDPITLNPVSDALSYEWSIVGNSSIISTNKRPLVTPLLNTSYIVKANLGLCEAKDTVLVKVFDYPTALINRDTTICSGRSVQLNGTITGTNFAWRPTAGMTNSNTLNPIVSPTQNTQYILSAFNVEGCTRVVEDTVLVRVVPPVVINVTRDTPVVIEQPLQFNATSNLDGITPPPTYTWTSTTSPNYLNNTSIANPIAIFPRGVTSMNYALNVRDINGCNATTNIKVTVFNTGADILVPTGFTPNSDALNNILRPFPVGIRQLTFFNVYNRFGQLIYTTSEVGKGWDGTFNGQKQPAGTYVFTAQGIDYLGNVLNKKGTVVLIR